MKNRNNETSNSKKRTSDVLNDPQNGKETRKNIKSNVGFVHAETRSGTRKRNRIKLREQRKVEKEFKEFLWYLHHIGETGQFGGLSIYQNFNECFKALRKEDLNDYNNRIKPLGLEVKKEGSDYCLYENNQELGRAINLEKCFHGTLNIVSPSAPQSLSKKSIVNLTNNINSEQQPILYNKNWSNFFAHNSVTDNNVNPEIKPSTEIKHWGSIDLNKKI